MNQKEYGTLSQDEEKSSKEEIKVEPHPVHYRGASVHGTFCSYCKKRTTAPKCVIEEKDHNERRLWKAAYKGDLEQIDFLLSQGANVNYQNMYVCTIKLKDGLLHGGSWYILHAAVVGGHIDAIIKILNAGARENVFTHPAKKTPRDMNPKLYDQALAIRAEANKNQNVTPMDPFEAKVKELIAKRTALEGMTPNNKPGLMQRVTELESKLEEEQSKRKILEDELQEMKERMRILEAKFSSLEVRHSDDNFQT